MPTYGPWQEGRIHEEVHYGRTVATVDDSHLDLLGEAPTRPSGWSLTWHNFGAQAERHWTHVGGLESPPPPRAEVSQGAFDDTKALPVGDNGFEFQFGMYSYGGRQKISAVNDWEAWHGWHFQSVEYKMGYQWPNDMDARYAIPAGMDNMTSEYTVELEPWVNGGDADITLLSVDLLGPGDTGDWGLFSKDAGQMSGFLRTAELEGSTSSVAESQIGMAPRALNVPAMESIMGLVKNGGNAIPGYASTSDYPGMPHMAWLYKGSPLSDPHFEGSRLVKATSGNQVAVRIRYQMPRWRQVFYTAGEGRFKVNVGSEELPQWKYLAPRAGENGGVGVGKVNIGTEASPIWQRLDRRFKVSNGGAFLREPPL